MKPYYQDESVTIYHGDCRDIVPQLGKFDLLLTDPPYGIDGGEGTISRARAKGDYANGADDSREYIRDVVVPILMESMGHCFTGIITPGCRNLDLYPQAKSFGCFYQPAATGMQHFGNMDAQPILYYGRHFMSGANLGRPCSFVLTEPPSWKRHPCSKPIKAWGRLLHLACPENGTVLDPFAGSCTTGRAAKDLWRKCVCIEREERYCEDGAKRMQQECLPFTTPIVKSAIKQHDLL
jgi:DNA modification methylase